MRVRITSDVLAAKYDGYPVDALWANGYVEELHEYIVPGVTDWKGIETRYDVKAQTMTVEADLDTVPVISGGDWDGQQVNEHWIRGYITGAGDCWLAPGTLRAFEVAFI